MLKTKYLLKQKNIIQERIINSFRKKIANLTDDLKKISELQKFFITKDEALKKKKNYNKSKDKYYPGMFDWYEIEYESDDIYLYQLFGVSISDILYAKCKIIQLNRCGYDLICLAGLYDINNNKLIGHKIIEEENILDAIENVCSFGIYDNDGLNKHLFIGLGGPFYSLSDVQEYAKKQVEEKDNNTNQTFKTFL